MTISGNFFRHGNSFKILLITHKALNGQAPTYISDLLSYFLFFLFFYFIYHLFISNLQ